MSSTSTESGCTSSWTPPPTYLPVADWQAGPYGYYDEISWLPPTAALLAQLALPVPPGFSGP
jgi:hypothetical protein